MSGLPLQRVVRIKPALVGRRARGGPGRRDAGGPLAAGVGPDAVKTSALALLTGAGPLIPLGVLVLTAALVFVVASRLIRQADVLATTTGLGRAWIGAVVLAAVTSLPEVLLNLSAGWLEAPDVGLGDLLGATLTNMVVLALLDLLVGRRRVLHAVAVQQAVLGGLGLVLTMVLGLALLTGPWGRVAHMGGESFVIAALYLGGMWLVYRAVVPSEGPKGRHRGRAWRAAAGVGSGAAGLAVLTPVLVVAAEALAQEANLTATFVGTVLVGLTTTLPETTTTVAALRLGAPDLAVANVFGSSAFNSAVVAVLDASYRRGPALAAVAADHQISVLLAALCMALGVMAILSQLEQRRGPVRVESLLMVLAWGVAAWLLGVA